MDKLRRKENFGLERTMARIIKGELLNKTLLVIELPIIRLPRIFGLDSNPWILRLIDFKTTRCVYGPDLFYWVRILLLMIGKAVKCEGAY